MRPSQAPDSQTPVSLHCAVTCRFGVPVLQMHECVCVCVCVCARVQCQTALPTLVKQNYMQPRRPGQGLSGGAAPFSGSHGAAGAPAPGGERQGWLSALSPRAPIYLSVWPSGPCRLGQPRLSPQPGPHLHWSTLPFLCPALPHSKRGRTAPAATPSPVCPTPRPRGCQLRARRGLSGRLVWDYWLTAAVFSCICTTGAERGNRSPGPWPRAQTACSPKFIFCRTPCHGGAPGHLLRTAQS